MTLLLIISILLRVAATVWSVVLLRRLRDWRMGFLTLMLGFMTYRQTATLWEQPQWWPPTRAGIEVEWSGLAVSVLAFLMVGFLAKLLTERRQAEAAVHESEARYHQLFAASPDAVFVMDRTGRFLDCNETAAQRYGYSQAELLLMSAQDLAAPDLREQAAARVKEAMATGKAFEWRHRRKDGTELPVEINAKPFEMGGQTLVLAGVRDITVRKLTEAELSRQHILLAAVLESTKDAIFAKDLAGRYLVANTASRRAMGVPGAEIIGRTDEELVPPEIARRYQETDARVSATGDSLTFEESRQMPDGLHHWLTSKTPLREADGRAIGVIGVAHDITERKQAEAALQESESKFRTLADSTEASIFVIQGERFRFGNPALVRLTGYTHDELLALKFWDTVHPDHRDLVHERGLARQRGEPVPARYEFKLLTKQGETRWVDFTAGVITYDGKPASLGTALDITERKQAEQALHDSRTQLRALLARLQHSREEERIRVSREVHDELGQLLTGLKMDVRWLERKLAEPGLPPALNPLLDRAVQASALADATIATVQKIAEGLRPGALDQLGLVASLKQEARRWQERNDVQCRVAAASWPELPPAITGELFYICREALTNVARHAGAKHVVISLKSADGAAVLEVCDDGAGITDAALRAPQSFGLLGIKERVAQCGGTVAFERNQPHGTRVTVRIPASERSEE